MFLYKKYETQPQINPFCPKIKSNALLLDWKIDNVKMVESDDWVETITSLWCNGSPHSNDVTVQGWGREQQMCMTTKSSFKRHVDFVFTLSPDWWQRTHVLLPATGCWGQDILRSMNYVRSVSRQFVWQGRAGGGCGRSQHGQVLAPTWMKNKRRSANVSRPTEIRKELL